MTGWLHTIRWKNLIIIWLCIATVTLPYFKIKHAHLFIEFIWWGIVCSGIAAIGNITNDWMDVKQDRENKKKNIFIKSHNKKFALPIITVIVVVVVTAIFMSAFQTLFLLIASVSMVLLLLYNLFLKKIAIVGNLVIAALTGLVFVGIDLIVLSRIAYFEVGFQNKQIELLALFAILTTLIREIIKDAEDRKGDLYAGFHTIAKFLKDRWIALLIFFLSPLGCIGFYFIINGRQTHFIDSFLLYSGWCTLVTWASAALMLIPHPSRYVRATRVIKAGMLGCLVIYLFLSL